MTRHLPFATALASILIGGYLQGNWTERWSRDRSLQDAAALVDRIPLGIGEWEAQPQAIDPREAAIGELAGARRLAYRHRQTGREVTALVVCGRPGPIAVHTPDICFGGAGYRAVEPISTERVECGPPDSSEIADFLTTRFRKTPESGSPTLRTYWAWNAQGRWEAPDHPRLAFARARFLYKCYFFFPEIRAPGAEFADPASFMQPFLTELDRTLAPAFRLPAPPLQERNWAVPLSGVTDRFP
jgi:hypothetical protein